MKYKKKLKQSSHKTWFFFGVVIFSFVLFFLFGRFVLISLIYSQNRVEIIAVVWVIVLI
jgi:hypothetical protein